jgi:hypothetical protein
VVAILFLMLHLLEHSQDALLLLAVVAVVFMILHKLE